MTQTAKWKQPYHWTRRCLAKIWLKLNPQIKIIGVTGSYGKTNTSRAIRSVLEQKAPALQTDLNLDTNYNLPITLLKLRLKHRFLVLEYGVDHKGEMAAHLGLVKPSIAILTGINPTHSEPELLGSLEGIIEEKGKLFQVLKKDDLALFNWHDPLARKMISKTKAKVIKYGFSPQADFWAEKIKVGFKGTQFTLHYQKEAISLKTGLIGQHFVQSCLAAAAVGRFCGLDWPQIQKGLVRLTPLKGRVSLEPGPKGSILINDALRANPASTMAGLQVLADLPTQGKRIAVLGEMGELGKLAEKSHFQVGQKAAELKKIDYLLGIGPLTKLILQGARKGGLKESQLLWAKDVIQAAETLKGLLRKGDLFYLKGSLLRHLERVLILLKGQKVNCQCVSCHVYQPCQECKKI